MSKIMPSVQKLNEIARQIPTPFYLYDEGALRRRARLLNRAFSWNEGYREYFAVKANPNPHLLKVMQEEDLGVDCASLTELMLAKACGFTGEEVMFSSNQTPADEYEYARAMNAVINLDDISHIDFLRDHGGIPERICLRYNPGAGFNVGGNYVMGHPEEAKFGMTGPQITSAVEKLMGLGAKRFGLHAFLVSNALRSEYYPSLAKLLFEMVRDLSAQTGARFDMVNLSGGIGIPYHPEDAQPDVIKIGEAVREAYDAVIGKCSLAPLSIATELGRWLTGPCGYLVTTAVHKKHIYRDYVGVDSSAVDLMRPAMYGAYHHITVVGKENAPLDRVYDVVGSLCENNDKFAVQRRLPKIDVGDMLVLHDAGAHGHSMGYNYNGKLRCAEVLLKDDGSFRLIRRAQTPEDYFATLDFPPLRELL
jgi:diaminopimelate decarboxylase